MSLIVLAWLAIVLGGVVALLLVLVAVLLLVPVVIDAAWGEERRMVSLAGPALWLGFDIGADKLELRLFSRRLHRWSTAGGGERERRPRRRKSRRASRPSPGKLWAQRREVLRALGRFFRRVRVRRLAMEARLATPDPAMTGWLTGAAFAVRGVAPASVRRGVRLTPDFEAESPSVDLEASVRLQPLHGALLALRMWRVMRRARVAADESPGAAAVAATWAATAWRVGRRFGRRTGRTGRTGRNTPGEASEGQDRGTDRPRGGGRERP